jgi:hypothetical protein
VPQERFDIYFAGVLLPDHPAETVKAWLGKQFKLEGAALDKLFTGNPVRIKQDVDMETAGRYRAAFRQAGALVEIRPVSATETPSSPPAAPAGNEPELLPANTGSLEDCAPQVASAEIPDISDMALGSPDQPIDDSPPPPAAEIATEHLSAEPANTGDLSDCVQQKPARPIPDISSLELSDD